MNSTVLVIALMVVGLVSNRLIRRRFPTVSRQQVFCAISAWVAGTLLVAGRTTSPFWYYTGLFVAVVMGTFLIMTWLQPRSTSPRAS
jgi:hypothetical protein